MPYLDITDYDQYVHMLQLFLHAHPQYRQINEAIREQRALPGEHFLSHEGMQALASWARERHLISRKTAARLIESATWSFATPADLVTLTRAVLGEPPQHQPVIRESEIAYFVTGEQPAPGEPDRLWRLPAAIEMLERAQADAATFAPNQQARARQLLAWLQEQVDGP
jgi:hypothetical protein